MSRPLALTLGEPAGIGPDITLAAWVRRQEFDLPAFYILADPQSLSRRARHLGLDVPLEVVTATNAGALVTPPGLEVIVASVVGANPTATITNSTTGKALVINPAVAATYTLDHRLRTITKSTGGDARTDLSAASEFWDLASGSNTITVTASNCTIGNTTISWRSRWA